MVLPDDESGESSEGILEGVRSPRDFVGLGTLTRPTAIDDPLAGTAGADSDHGDDNDSSSARSAPEPPKMMIRVPTTVEQGARTRLRQLLTAYCVVTFVVGMVGVVVGLYLVWHGVDVTYGLSSLPLPLTILIGAAVVALLAVGAFAQLTAIGSNEAPIARLAMLAGLVMLLGAVVAVTAVARGKERNLDAILGDGWSNATAAGRDAVQNELTCCGYGTVDDRPGPSCLPTSAVPSERVACGAALNDDVLFKLRLFQSAGFFLILWLFLGGCFFAYATYQSWVPWSKFHKVVVARDRRVRDAARAAGLLDTVGNRDVAVAPTLNGDDDDNIGSGASDEADANDSTRNAPPLPPIEDVSEDEQRRLASLDVGWNRARGSGQGSYPDEEPSTASMYQRTPDAFRDDPGGASGGFIPSSGEESDRGSGVAGHDDSLAAPSSVHSGATAEEFY